MVCSRIHTKLIAPNTVCFEYANSTVVMMLYKSKILLNAYDDHRPWLRNRPLQPCPMDMEPIARHSDYNLVRLICLSLVWVVLAASMFDPLLKIVSFVAKIWKLVFSAVVLLLLVGCLLVMGNKRASHCFDFFSILFNNCGCHLMPVLVSDVRVDSCKCIKMSAYKVDNLTTVKR